MIMQRLEKWPFEGLPGGISEFDRLRHDLNRLLSNRSGGNGWDSPAGVFPLLNVSQDNDHIYVRSEIPGIVLDQLDVSVTGRSLSISGERAIGDENSNVRYHRRERESGKFRRQLNLPTDVDNDKVQAKYQHGILMVVLPKSEKAKPKKISISG
jgi:HSP20 family protein